MKYLSIPLIFLFEISCSTKKADFAKNDFTIKVELNTVYDDPSRGFTILYPMHTLDDSTRSKIMYPDLSNVSDTVFANIYFTGPNHGAIISGVLVLIGNYASKSPLIWVDYNNDLNFSDAKNPLRFSKDFVEVSVPDIHKPDLAHIIRFHKPDSAKKPEIKSMLEQYIIKGEEYADFFMDERRNIRVGDFVFKKDSLRIGLMDWNVNGTYNDTGTDRIVIGKYGGTITGTDEASGAVVLDSTTYFQAGNYAFEVVKISANGKSISIKPTSSNKPKKRITKGTIITDYTFTLYSGEKTSIHKHLKGNKYLYLSFWANWCVGCHHEIDYLKKIHARYSNKITIISLNYNENSEKIKAFMNKHGGIEWLNGLSTSEINEELLIQGLPRNILIDSTGKIVEMNIHPTELLKRIDEL